MTKVSATPKVLAVGKGLGGESEQKQQAWDIGVFQEIEQGTPNMGDTNVYLIIKYYCVDYQPIFTGHCRKIYVGYLVSCRVFYSIN